MDAAWPSTPCFWVAASTAAPALETELRAAVPAVTAAVCADCEAMVVVAKPENWLAALARNGHGLESEEPLDPATRAGEALLMGLRLDEGVDLARIAALTGVAVDALVDDRQIAALPGLIERRGDHLRVTEAGMILLDAILPRVVRTPDAADA